MALPLLVNRLLRLGLAVLLFAYSSLTLFSFGRAVGSPSNELSPADKRTAETSVTREPFPTLFQVSPNDKEYDIYESLPTDMPIVVERYRFLFFPNYKTGSTAWKAVLRKMMGHTERLTTFHMIHDFQQNGLKRLGDFSVERAQEIMTDPNWTRAMFIRDPMERWLSSYLHFGERGITKMCCRQEAARRVCFDRESKRRLSQAEHFFEIMSKCRNNHWALQTELFAPKYLQQLNWIGNYHTMQSDAEALMRKVGAWEEHGASGWGPLRKDPAFTKRTTDREGTDILDGQSHATHASAKLGSYVTPYLYARLLEHYRRDYSNPLFNLTVPTFEQIQNSSQA